MNKTFFIHQITIYHLSESPLLENWQISNLTVEEINKLEIKRMFKLDSEKLEQYNGEYIIRIPYKDVYFLHNKKSNLIDKGLEKGSTGTIFIPTTKDLSNYISEGDWILEGLKAYDFNEMYKNPKIPKYRVVSIDDNRRGSLQHYQIGVSD